MLSSAGSCLFAVRGVADEAEFRSRVARLSAAYGSLTRAADLHWNDSLRFGAGVIQFGGAPAIARSAGWLGHWGESVPSSLAAPVGVIGASDGDLRALDRPVALIAIDSEVARIVTGATGPTALYCGGGREVSVWATHAAAVAVLAGDGPRLDASMLPQLFAFGFVGGRDTHLRGVRAVDSATLITITVAGDECRSYWPLSERWAPVPESEAHEHAERHLLDSLGRRLVDARTPWLGLTGGLDSRAVAVALSELGIPFRAFTWGHRDWPDVQEAKRVAEELDIEHRALDGDWIEEDTAISLQEEEARWHEGLGLLPLFALPEWPAGTDAYVTGGAGETGRAFYYRLLAASYRRPSADQLDALWRPEHEIAGAREEAIQAVRDVKRSWLQEAARTGHDGWRLLDVIYGEQRYRRWARPMLPRTAFPLIPAFADPEVQRALASLPLRSRLTDGFHRTFIQGRRPDLVPAAGPRQRPGVPPIVRRLAQRRRARRPARGEPWGMSALWLDRPRMREWIADDALGRKSLSDALGEAWAQSTRIGFLADDRRATEHALIAASLASMEDAFAMLA